ncbi:MAG: hypothetical protein JW984_13755 [Deltaproteobacteria bacterium]|uniref:Uncharacterized protein n=1 Tax=Candidatus Zymogenus saltonus TaxID=2844893 RepID=A0A9D8KHK3_9DELT|nr:hypothetical protein [Candidatus Zymogenus saltonus]
MKIPEDIRLLLIVVATIGAVTGVAVLMVVFAPAIGKNAELSVRVILAILLAFVTLKFFLYIMEAAIVVIGGDRVKKIERGRSALKSAHPAVRAVVIVTLLVATFTLWYLLIRRFGVFILPDF